MGVAFYRGAEACILVYDITSPKSFESVNQWRHDFESKACPKNPETYPYFLMGNKADRVDQRKVDLSYVEGWCRRNNNIPYEETSALEGTNVEKAFTNIAKFLLNQELTSNVPTHL